MCRGTGALLLLAPLCGAWMGSGSGDAEWSAGHGQRVADETRLALDAVARVAPGDVHAVLSIPLPDGDAVLTLRTTGEGGFELPHPRVEVQYDEYDGDGEVVFAAGEVAGHLWVGRRRDEVAVELDLELRDDVDPGVWRRLAHSSFEVSPVLPLPSGYDGSGSGADDDPDVVVVGGCDEGWDSAADDSGGGCEGDEWDAGDDSGGGCEGDDLDTGGGGCDGCEGDAIAADGCPTRRRSPLLARALLWMPWLLVFAFVRLWRSLPVRRQGR